MRMIASWVWVFATHRIQGCGTSLIAPQKAGSPRNRRPGQYQRADVLGAVKAWPDKHRCIGEKLVRRPTLTAPARDSACVLRVGTKKRVFRLNQETRNKEKEDALNKALDS